MVNNSVDPDRRHACLSSGDRPQDNCGSRSRRWVWCACQRARWVVVGCRRIHPERPNALICRGVRGWPVGWSTRARPPSIAALCVRVAFGWCSPERAGPLMPPGARSREPSPRMTGAPCWMPSALWTTGHGPGPIRDGGRRVAAPRGRLLASGSQVEAKSIPKSLRLLSRGAIEPEALAYRFWLSCRSGASACGVSRWRSPEASVVRSKVPA